MASEVFLMWSRRGSSGVYAAEGLGLLWHRLCVSAGVLNAKGHPPRVHDLRHSCAVLVLQRCYAQGVDVQAMLPQLATYLGHASAVSTHYYLKLTPELLSTTGSQFQTAEFLGCIEGNIGELVTLNFGELAMGWNSSRGDE